MAVVAIKEETGTAVAAKFVAHLMLHWSSLSSEVESRQCPPAGRFDGALNGISRLRNLLYTNLQTTLKL